MLMAIDKQGNRKYAGTSEKKDKDGNKINYYCPECHNLLTLRKGMKNIHHFAHTQKTRCSLREKGSESLTHMNMKNHIKEKVETYNELLRSELEWRIGEYIADYYFEIRDDNDTIRKCAVECVHKHTDLQDFREKTKAYHNKGIYTLWLFNLHRFLKDSITFKDEVTVNDIIKEAHAMNYGKIYAIDPDDKELYAIHLERIEREVDAVDLIDWDSWDGHSDPTIHTYSVGGYTKYLKNKRRINPFQINEFYITAFKRNRADKYLPYPRSTAGCFIRPFWK